MGYEKRKETKVWRLTEIFLSGGTTMLLLKLLEKGYVRL